MKCPKCGTDINENDEFCFKCGVKLIKTNNSSYNPNPGKNKVGVVISILIISLAIVGLINMGIDMALNKKVKQTISVENNIIFENYSFTVPHNYSCSTDENGALILRASDHYLYITKINTSNEQIIKKKDNIINEFKKDGITVSNFKTQTLNDIEFVTYNTTKQDTTNGYMYGKINNDIEICIHIKPEIDSEGNKYAFKNVWFIKASHFISTAKLNIKD